MSGATLLGYRRIQTVTIVPETPGGTLEAFAFDTVMDMQETSPGQAFRHPLQNGYEGITDGTRLEPEEFSLTGLVTDTPIRFLLPFSARSHPGAAALYEQLKALRRRQVAVSVITSWAGVLTGRWPETITGKHGAGQGASIELSVNFVKFNIVFTTLVPQQVDADVLLLGAQSVSAQPG
jgi:hypothetical protein